MKWLLINAFVLLTACTPFRNLLSPSDALFTRPLVREDVLLIKSVEEAGDRVIRQSDDILKQELAQSWFLKDTIQVLIASSGEKTTLVPGPSPTVTVHALIRQTASSVLFDPDQSIRIDIQLSFHEAGSQKLIGRISKSGSVKNREELIELVRTIRLR